MQLLDPKLAVIHREKFKIKGDLAQVLDEFGNHYWDFPGSMTDEQIMSALRFANWSHAVGFNAGDEDRLNRIKSAMEK